MFALRGLQLSRCLPAVLPMEALALGLRQQQAAVSSGPVGAVYNVGQATNIRFHDGMVPRRTKEELLEQKGVVLWFTGNARATP